MVEIKSAETKYYSETNENRVRKEDQFVTFSRHNSNLGLMIYDRAGEK